MRFQWDPDKYDTNLRKHGVRFEAAITVFDDPNEITREDRDAVDEQRWRTIGRPVVGPLLFVIHAERGMIDGEVVVRIISARLADAPERRCYERQTQLR
jgi:hypothetical protein